MNPGIILPALRIKPQGKSVAKEQIPPTVMSDYMLHSKNYIDAMLKQDNKI